jgi:hypothetical protein
MYNCTQCDTEITYRENSYSVKHYGEPLCRDCQNDHNDYKEKEVKTNNGVNGSGKESIWVSNVIKGRIAETIVEELFRSLGFQVYKYGMEHTIPGITDLLKGIKDDVAMNIRRMPDFVIFKDDRAHFLEVKFRANEQFSIEDIDRNRDYPFHNALILLVSKKHIKCISYQELADGKEITPTCRNYLGSRKEFETDKEVIKAYCDYAIKFFETV